MHQEIYLFVAHALLFFTSVKWLCRVVIKTVFFFLFSTINDFEQKLIKNFTHITKKLINRAHLIMTTRVYISDSPRTSIRRVSNEDLTFSPKSHTTTRGAIIFLPHRESRGGVGDAHRQ